ncbi:MAG TPA: dihydroneopterin aldolase [Candidatus Babeliales bacterium]|nr:dihydroneopterin aldolase [Candidatus Babeliales bacterium]
MQLKPKCALIIEDLKLKVNLGVTAKERKKKQQVLVSIKINFSYPPKACETGEISDTVCYDTLTQEIKKFCRHKEFTLIENLGMRLFLLVKKSIFKDSELYLSVVKQRPLRELACSVFEIRDVYI